MTLEGNPWFVAKDVAGVLGFTLDNLKYHLKTNVGDDEGQVVKLPTIKGMQGLKFLSESGLYKLIMRSDKPQAKPFQDWVTKDVLPAIRKDGAYVMKACPQAVALRGEEKLASGDTPVFAGTSNYPGIPVNLIVGFPLI